MEKHHQKFWNRLFGSALLRIQTNVYEFERGLLSDLGRRTFVLCMCRDDQHFSGNVKRSILAENGSVGKELRNRLLR